MLKSGESADPAAATASTSATRRTVPTWAEEADCGLPPLVAEAGTAQRNPWGSESYAELITKAIQSAPNARAMLPQSMSQTKIVPVRQKSKL